MQTHRRIALRFIIAAGFVTLAILASTVLPTQATGKSAATTSKENSCQCELLPIHDIQLILFHRKQAAIASSSSPGTAESPVSSVSTTTTSTTAPTPTTTTSTSPPSITTGVPATYGGDATSTDTPDWNCIGEHESGNNYTESGGGRWQFENGTWESVTGLAGPAENYPPAVQDAAALKLYGERGWEPWTTRFVCGLG